MKEFRFTQKLMGTKFEFVIFAKDHSEANIYFELAANEIKRIELKLTEFSSDSITSQINANAFEYGFKLDDEVYGLLYRCQSLYNLSQGAFDITTAPLKALYDFKGLDFNFPSQAKVNETLKSIGYHRVHLSDNRMVKFDTPGVKISFAAIGKGYAADRVSAIWKENGLKGGIISASGDMKTVGNRPDNQPWSIGIAHPDNPEQSILHVAVEDAAVATSGNYEQYFLRQGKLYGHTIDPKTGYPCQGIKSVSVISPSAELSDALATAVMVMGIEVGLHFIGQLPHVHAIIVDDSNEVHGSENINFVLNDQKSVGDSPVV